MQAMSVWGTFNFTLQIHVISIIKIICNKLTIILIIISQKSIHLNSVSWK